MLSEKKNLPAEWEQKNFWLSNQMWAVGVVEFDQNIFDIDFVAIYKFNFVMLTVAKDGQYKTVIIA